jgi:hypothetical protein
VRLEAGSASTAPEAVWIDTCPAVTLSKVLCELIRDELIWGNLLSY